MTSEIRSLRDAVVRSILRVSTAVLLVGLVSGPAPASAEDMVLKWNDTQPDALGVVRKRV